MIDWQALAAEFPRGAVHWRAQTLTKNGDKALALAYLDARNVQNRLDDVCGPAGWATEFTETPSGRVLCTLSIKVGDEWVAKTDGAGNTDVEGEKGAISDAFKRAAVHWGIGRYLYALDAVWVPCETWTDNNGKPRWKKWKGDPWAYVRSNPMPEALNAHESSGAYEDRARDALGEDANNTAVAVQMAREMKLKMTEYKTVDWLEKFASSNQGGFNFIRQNANGAYEDLRKHYAECKKAIEQQEAA